MSSSYADDHDSELYIYRPKMNFSKEYSNELAYIDTD